MLSRNESRIRLAALEDQLAGPIPGRFLADNQATLTEAANIRFDRTYP